MKSMARMFWVISLICIPFYGQGTPQTKAVTLHVETVPSRDFGVRIFRSGKDQPIVDNISFGGGWVDDVNMPSDKDFTLESGDYELNVFVPGYNVEHLKVHIEPSELLAQKISVNLTANPRWTEVIQLHTQDLKSSTLISFFRDGDHWAFSVKLPQGIYFYTPATKSLRIAPNPTPTPVPISVELTPEAVSPLYPPDQLQALLKIQSAQFPEMPILRFFEVLDKSPSRNLFAVLGEVIGPRFLIFVIDLDNNKAYYVGTNPRYDKLLSDARWSAHNVLFLFHPASGIESFNSPFSTLETVIPPSEFWLATAVTLFAPDLSYLVTVGGPGTGLWTYDLTDVLKTAN
jgi:hypothetical protein